MNILAAEWCWLCPDVIDALRATGHAVTTFQQKDDDLAPLQNALRQIRADVVFSVNFFPEIARVTAESQLPYICWVVDNVANSYICSPEHRQSNTVMFFIDRTTMAVFQSNGYSNCFYLPIGSNTRRFHPGLRSKQPPATLKGLPCEVSFVGSSVMDNSFAILRSGFEQAIRQAPDEPSRELNRLVWKAITTIVTAAGADLLHPDIEGKLRLASEQLGFDLVGAVSTDPKFFHIVLGKEITARKRTTLIRELAGVCPVTVFGDGYWKDIPHVLYQREAAYQHDTPWVYAGSKITVNIERVYNTAWLNLRILDALACGTFVMTEHHEEVVRFFEPGTDLDTFRSIEELKDKTRYYLAHESERMRIAASGSSKVRARHSFEHRIKQLLDMYQS